MSKPESFVLTTDYGTLKNDAIGSMTLTLPPGMVIPAMGQGIYETFLTIGTQNAGIRSRMYFDGFSENWTPAISIVVKLRMFYSIDGNTYDWYTTAIIKRISPSRLRMYVAIQNPFGFFIRTAGSTTTVKAEIATFLSPFN